jgi:16S rRNA (guanine527-N7)-methyltransferase
LAPATPSRVDAGARSKVAELLQRYSLPDRAEPALLALLDSLATDPLAPTSVREPAMAVDTHLADSLVALELEQVRAARSVADLGSGAGFPGLPLAVALPGTRFWLLESNARKCAFIERARVAAGLANVEVVPTRAEAWSEGLERFGLVTARAVARLAVVAEYAAPLLTLGGTLMVWRGQRDVDDEDAANRAAAELGLESTSIHKVRPFPGAESRHLYLMSKVRETPDRFPRRPGIALKRPLGGPSDRGRR